METWPPPLKPQISDQLPLNLRYNLLVPPTCPIQGHLCEVFCHCGLVPPQVNRSRRKGQLSTLPPFTSPPFSKDMVDKMT